MASVASRKDIDEMKYAAIDREELEVNSRTCWNKFTRLLDKFVEIIFIFSLVGNGIWNMLSMFLGSTEDKKFSFLRFLLCFYYWFLALLIFTSWRSNIGFLTYFGFMRGTFSKSLFLLFCACLCFPNKYSTRQNTVLSYVIAYVLIISACLQILKTCNKNEAKDLKGKNWEN